MGNSAGCAGRCSVDRKRAKPTDLLTDALESPDHLLDLRIPSLLWIAEQRDKLVDRPLVRVNGGIDDHVSESVYQSGALFAAEARGGEGKPRAKIRDELKSVKLRQADSRLSGGVGK
jgi:hypothetical protein